eukprot:Filipodium_phascolosomae@DN465_c0_g1_i2.p1
MAVFEVDALPSLHEHLTDAPAEFYYIWAICSVTMVITVVLFAIRWREHLVFGEKVRKIKGYVFQPKQTRLTIRILFLFPVLAVCSWVPLFNLRQAKLLDVLKHFYEMICLFWFWELLVVIMGGDESAMEILIQRPPFKIYGSMPIFCFRPCAKLRRFTRRDFVVTKCLVAQYAFFGPTVAIIDAFNETYLPYFHVARIISGVFCMWGVVILFAASRIALREFRVTLKFISLKCTVLVLNLLTLLIHQVATPVEHSGGKYTQEVMAEVWTNFMYSVMTLSLMIIAYFGFPSDDVALREKRVNGFELAGVCYPQTPRYSAKCSTFAMTANSMNIRYADHPAARRGVTVPASPAAVEDMSSSSSSTATADTTNGANRICDEFQELNDDDKSVYSNSESEGSVNKGPVQSSGEYKHDYWLSAHSLPPPDNSKRNCKTVPPCFGVSSNEDVNTGSPGGVTSPGNQKRNNLKISAIARIPWLNGRKRRNSEESAAGGVDEGPEE